MKKLFLLGALLVTTTGSTDVPKFIQLTEHDAVGRVQQATAILNDADYSCPNGVCTLRVDYTTDQLFCSAFGPGQ